MSSVRGRGRGRGRGILLKSNMRSSDLNTPPHPVYNSNYTPPNIKKSYSQSNIITVDLNLDANTGIWFLQFKNLWNMLKKCPSVTNMLHQHFETVENPYEQALRLMYNCLDFKYAKSKSLSYMIMEEFKIWSTMSRNKIINLLTRPLKISAFNVVRQQSIFSLMKLVAEVYEMAADCDIFLDIIMHMVQEKQYKEACLSAALLGLHANFGIEEFLIPLVLQDKLFCLEEFLVESPQHQSSLIAFLDTTLGQASSIRSALDPLIMKLHIPDVKWEKLHFKPWRKLITRLVKMYNLPADTTPCLNKKRNEGALQFLLNKRFVEHSFGDESWQEMVQEAVQDDEKLQLELITQVNLYGDAAEALKWAHFYKVPRDYWPYNVRLLHDNPEQDRHQQQSLNDQTEENWDASPNVDATVYHKLELPYNCIYLVDNVFAFETFLDNMLQDIAIVGVDCEWKPSFGVHKNELALMQIATRKAVYILDIVQLGNKTPLLWQEFGKFLFNNCDILKLGFGFTSDLSMIKDTLPNVSLSQKVGFLDLLQLWKQIEKHPNIKLPHEVQSGGPSLSTLVQQCLGHPLDKSDQFSNWEKRPLRQSQLEYAALDAYCLIQVYDVLKKCCDVVNFPFDETCYNLMSSSRPSKKKSKKNLHKTRSKDNAAKEIAQPPNPCTDPVPADKIRLVCDTMLQGLGKSLRKCGIDTAILENNDDHQKCVRFHQDERRYILTRGHAFNKLTGYVPQGHCFNVKTDDIDEQLKQVLEYYNVVVTKDNVFSRCQACNSNSFVKISKSTMNSLAISSKKAEQMRYFIEDDLADEATGFSSDEDYDDVPRVPVSYTRKWELCPEEQVDLGLSLTRCGAKIQVDSVPPGILEKHDFFYVCEDCGKVYWDGTHFDKVLSNRLQNIVI